MKACLLWLSVLRVFQHELSRETKVLWVQVYGKTAEFVYKVVGLVFVEHGFDI